MKAKEDRRRSTLDWFVAHPMIEIRKWVDPVNDQCGFDARHVYVETYWLPILGPSTVLAARRIADQLDRQPAGVSIDLVEFGASLGIGAGTGRNTQINRTLGRLVDFGMARISGDHLEVHTTLPAVPPRLRRRLPLSLLDALTDHERSCLDSA
jgi:hypothetical protein